jgi:hypothetical protein
MIEVGQRYVVNKTFRQSDRLMEVGWMFTIKANAGSQWSCEFDEPYYPNDIFHDCCGECAYGLGFYVYGYKIEESCIPAHFSDNASWEL